MNKKQKSNKRKRQQRKTVNVVNKNAVPQNTGSTTPEDLMKMDAIYRKFYELYETVDKSKVSNKLATKIHDEICLDLMKLEDEIKSAKDAKRLVKLMDGVIGYYGLYDTIYKEYETLLAKPLKNEAKVNELLQVGNLFPIKWWNKEQRFGFRKPDFGFIHYILEETDTHFILEDWTPVRYGSDKDRKEIPKETFRRQIDDVISNVKKEIPVMRIDKSVWLEHNEKSEEDRKNSKLVANMDEYYLPKTFVPTKGEQKQIDKVVEAMKTDGKVSIGGMTILSGDACKNELNKMFGIKK